uniref:ARAD1B06094p n=1 Tax=Blastobotrys adeninivorans TaxID=409370 RepID=A0A060T4V2_BLAAD
MSPDTLSHSLPYSLERPELENDPWVPHVDSSVHHATSNGGAASGVDAEIGQGHDTGLMIESEPLIGSGPPPTIPFEHQKSENGPSGGQHPGSNIDAQAHELFNTSESQTTVGTAPNHSVKEEIILDETDDEEGDDNDDDEIEVERVVEKKNPDSGTSSSYSAPLTPATSSNDPSRSTAPLKRSYSSLFQNPSSVVDLTDDDPSDSRKRPSPHADSELEVVRVTKIPRPGDSLSLAGVHKIPVYQNLELIEKTLLPSLNGQNRDYALRIVRLLKNKVESAHQRERLLLYQMEKQRSRIQELSALARDQPPESNIRTALHSLVTSSTTTHNLLHQVKKELEQIQSQKQFLFHTLRNDYKTDYQYLVEGRLEDLQSESIDYTDGDYSDFKLEGSRSSSQQRPSSLFSSTQHYNGPFAGPSSSLHYDRTFEVDLKGLLDTIPWNSGLNGSDRTGTPEELKVSLLEHQKMGLSWLQAKEDKLKGGILADDMGLGKTIQILALLVSRKSEDPKCKTTLVIAPVALLRQWEREIQTKVKREHALKVYVHHSSSKKLLRNWEAMSQYDVVITTYGLISREYREHKALGIEQANNSEAATPSDSGISRPNTPRDNYKNSPFYTHKWFRVVLDEAQYIKNKNTLAAKACSELEAEFRWCLSGTPMQNKVDELYSLIKFLRIKPYCEEKRFARDIGSGLRGAMSESSIQKLRALLSAILLRRTKKSEVDGRPILTLPPRTVELTENVFDKDEEAYYRQLETGYAERVSKYFKANTVGKNYSSILTLLLRLRQACCHPALIAKSEQQKREKKLKEASPHTLKQARRLSPDVVQRVKELETFECPICCDAVDPSVVMITACGHYMCDDCMTRFFSQEGREHGDDGDESCGECPSCKRTISESKMIDYDTFRLVHVMLLSDSEVNQLRKQEQRRRNEEQKRVQEAIRKRRERIQDNEMFHDEFTNQFFDLDANDDDKQDSRKDSEDNIDKHEGLKDEDFNDFMEMQGIQDTGDVKNEVVDVKHEEVKDVKSEDVKHEDVKDIKDEDVKDISALDISDIDDMDEKFGNDENRLIVRELGLEKLFPDGWISSTKIDKCMELVNQIQQEFPGEKVIIFSQFTSLLDLLNVPLILKGYDYLRYDGSMTATARNETVIEFFDNPEKVLMLVSLKAGNVGLTLTCASHVIIMDPFWNPFVEEQAIDRAHRIGQERPVYVHRLAIKNSVEDRILSLQEEKRKLINAALDEGAFHSASRLDTSQLMYLFGLQNRD